MEAGLRNKDLVDSAKFALQTYICDIVRGQLLEIVHELKGSFFYLQYMEEEADLTSLGGPISEHWWILYLLRSCFIRWTYFSCEEAHLLFYVFSIQSHCTFTTTKLPKNFHYCLGATFFSFCDGFLLIPL